LGLAPDAWALRDRHRGIRPPARLALGLLAGLALAGAGGATRN